MPSPRGDRQPIAALENSDLPAALHFHPASNDEEGLMLDAVSMPRAGLPGENEKVFSAIARRHLIRDPVFDEAESIEITETEIEHERLDRRKGNVPLLDLRANPSQRSIPEGSGHRDRQATCELIHGCA